MNFCLRKTAVAMTAFLVVAGCKDQSLQVGDDENAEDEYWYVEVSEDETWSEDKTLFGIYHVQQGVTLTITPGTKVTFFEGSGISSDGTLIAAGAEFSGPTNGAWGITTRGVVDLDGASTSDFNLRVEGDAASTLKNMTLTNTELAIQNREAALTLDSLTFENGNYAEKYAIRLNGAKEAIINNLTASNVAGAIYTTPSGPGSSVTINTANVTNSRVFVNWDRNTKVTVVADGVTATGSHAAAFDIGNGDLTLTNSVFSELSSHGIYAYYGSSLEIDQLSVTNSSGTAIYSLGDVVANGVTVTNQEGSGLQAKSLNLTASTFTDLTGWAVNVGEDGGMADGVTIERSLSHGFTGHGYDTAGAFTVKNSTITDVGSHGIHRDRGDLTIENTTIDGTESYAVAAYRNSLTLETVNVRNAKSWGIYSTEGTLTANNVVVEDGRSGAIQSYYGDLIGTNITARRNGSYSIYTVEGDMTLTNVTLEEHRSYGIYANRSNLVATNVTSVDGENRAIQVSRGNFTIDGLTVTNNENWGMGCFIGTGSAVNVSMTNVQGGITCGGNVVNPATHSFDMVTINGTTGSHGISYSNGDVTVTNTTVTGSASYGVYNTYGNGIYEDVVVTNPASYGIFTQYGDMTATNVTVTNNRAGYGVFHRYPRRDGTPTSATIENATVSGSASWGIYMNESGTLANSDVQASLHGVFLRGNAASSITGSTISNNTTYGIQGESSTIKPSLTDVSGNNIEGNGNYGVRYVQNVDNNYISENNGQVGAAVSTGGTVDGTRNTTLDSQIQNVDAVTSQSAVAL